MESGEKLQDDLENTIAGAETPSIDGSASPRTKATSAILGMGDDPGSSDMGSQVVVSQNESQNRPRQSYTTVEDVMPQVKSSGTRGTLSAPRAFDGMRAANDMQHASDRSLKRLTPTEDRWPSPSSPRSQAAPDQQSHDVTPMIDLEAQVVEPSLQGPKKTAAAPEVPKKSAVPSSQSPRTAADQNSCRNSEDYDGEQAGLYDLAEKLRNENPAVEPWFLEMSRLRRIYILWLNKRLSLCRKSILGQQRASDKDMKALGEVLHLQAEAIRDLQTVRALDFLTPGEQEKLHDLTGYYLKKTAASNFEDVDPFETENYRRLRPAADAVIFDGVREMLRTYLPKQISWSKEEKILRRELYDEGIYMPEVLSTSAESLARFIIAAGGGLFILCPTYIMALHQNLTKSLVTTTIAVVLFVLVCSVPLKLANDQIFSSTFGYAAVLMVFVGLTSSPQQ